MSNSQQIVGQVVSLLSISLYRPSETEAATHGTALNAGDEMFALQVPFYAQYHQKKTISDADGIKT